MGLLTLILLFLPVLFITFTYLWLKKPNTLNHIPSISAFKWLGAMINPEAFDIRSNKLNRDQLRKSKIQAYWRFGRWGVVTSSKEAAKKIFNDTVTFPKNLPTEILPNAFLTKFLGINLVFSNHEVWKRYRSVLNPPFKKQFDPEIFASCTRLFFNLIDEKFSRKEVDVYKYMQRITMDALGKGIMGIEFNSVIEEEVYFISAYNKIMYESTNALFLIFRAIDKEWFPLRKDAFKTLKGFKEYFKNIIESKKKILSENPGLTDASHVDTDILTLMVQASQGEDAQLTEEEIMNNIMIFVLAGHDTTAFAISGILHFLAQNPHVQDRARKEVLEVMGLDDYYRGQPENCPAPNTEQAKQMVYLMAVMKESIRLYPSVAKLPERRTSKEVEIEGYIIPPNTTVELDIYCMHRDPDNFFKPEEFIPERFLEDNKFGKDSFSDQSLWTPFGGGARSCIGMNFSILEQKVVLSMILMRYKVSYPQSCPQANGAPLSLKPYGLLVPDNLKLNFELM